jgi:hypothetical protein
VTIDVEPQVQEVLRVRLVGRDYEVVAPKTSLALGMAQKARKQGEGAYLEVIDGLEAWVRGAFGEQASEVAARLADPDDPLDVGHIFSLLKAVTGRASAVPTS